jgi:hypothetical protein
MIFWKNKYFFNIFEKYFLFFLKFIDFKKVLVNNTTPLNLEIKFQNFLIKYTFS